MCEASVCIALVDGEGVPLNVGREKRLFTPAIRKALVIRDRGCAFPGCGAPASWCDAHHVEHWEHGGETSIGNGVLLCRRHHTVIHHGGWAVFLGRDGHPWFTPPADAEHPSRGREPMRSHGRRTLTSFSSAA
ncbi:HNH endonuclease signature motif containing protein [Gordonia sp. (in: high G+C Gram-positive bacteria)]|uniref:HNH endonuclease signature motif containing protein n=1 Tax=Gordonia sp. (in: high G+C Gram-positive bacteria) TaxID=84139 RepID=UPI0039E2192F